MHVYIHVKISKLTRHSYACMQTYTWVSIDQVWSSFEVDWNCRSGHWRKM